MEALDISKPVRTRSGLPARIVCADRDTLLPIIALYRRQDIVGEHLIAAKADGRTSDEEHPLDLVNVPEGEATYPVNPLIQLLADPSEDEFRRVCGRVEEAIARSAGQVDDRGVALALLMGMMQEVRTRAALPPVFSAAIAELFRLRAADAELARLRAPGQAEG